MTGLTEKHNIREETPAQASEGTVRAFFFIQISVYNGVEL